MFLFFRGLFQSASLGHFHLYLFHYKELENGTSKVSVWFCKNLRSSKLATKVAFEWAFFLIRAFLRGFFHKCFKLSSFHFPQLTPDSSATVTYEYHNRFNLEHFAPIPTSFPQNLFIFGQCLQS